MANEMLAPGASVRSGPRQRCRSASRVSVVLLLIAAVVVGVLMIDDGVSDAHPGAHAQPLPPTPFTIAPSVAGQLPEPPALKQPQPGSIVRHCAPDARRPAQVQIPSLCIFAPLVLTHVDDGALIIPEDVHTVGLDIDSAPLASKEGTTILAGHVDDMNQGDGSFYFLHDVKPGALITVTDETGHQSKWKAYSVTSVSKAELPTSIWHTTGPRRLLLVTCGGALIHYSWGNSYANNILVYATPAVR